MNRKLRIFNTLFLMKFEIRFDSRHDLKIVVNIHTALEYIYSDVYKLSYLLKAHNYSGWNNCLSLKFVRCIVTYLISYCRILFD